MGPADLSNLPSATSLCESGHTMGTPQCFSMLQFVVSKAGSKTLFFVDLLAA